jgi:hypothetical protein
MKLNSYCYEVMNRNTIGEAYRTCLLAEIRPCPSSEIGCRIEREAIMRNFAGPLSGEGALQRFAATIQSQRATILGDWRESVRRLPAARDLDVPTLNKLSFAVPGKESA